MLETSSAKCARSKGRGDADPCPSDPWLPNAAGVPVGSHPPLAVPWGHKTSRRPPLPRRSGPEALPRARPPRPGRLTLVGLRQRVLPFQVLERLTRPNLPWPLPRPQQKEKEQHPGPIPSRQTPLPPSPPPRGYHSHRHLSHRRPFIKSPPRLTNHWPMEPSSRRSIGSRRSRRRR